LSVGKPETPYLQKERQGEQAKGRRGRRVNALGSERLGVTLVGVEVSDLALFVAFRVSDV
jgi:hypothetical protein